MWIKKGWKSGKTVENKKTETANKIYDKKVIKTLAVSSSKELKAWGIDQNLFL